MGVLRALTELAATFGSAHVVVLCYHRIRSRQRFADQMAALSERGYSVLSMPQFTEWLNGSQLPSHSAALLTFDHCYAEQLESALPVLDELTFPATFFPASADLARERPGVAAHWRNTLLELTKAGHTVGCHTHNHPILTRLPTTHVRQEVLRRRLALEYPQGHGGAACGYQVGAMT